MNLSFLFAPDSFKGSLSAQEIITQLDGAAKAVFPQCTTLGIPMADGGEGTLAILTELCHGRTMTQVVQDPLGNPHTAQYAILEDGTALIEMAAASGLPLVPPHLRNPEITSTYGTGQLIQAALDNGCRRFVIGVGGSATNDGGMGAISALGVHFLDADGAPLSPVGGNLSKVITIDTSCIHPAIKDSTFTVMCDIDNPLVGERGATYVFAPQKGATEEQILQLEAGMCHYASILKEQLGIDPSYHEGAGAAGGLAAGLMVFLGGQLQSGIETVLSLSHFEEKLQGVDLVITGEGRVDNQSAQGKVLWGVGTTCSKHNIPVVAITGGIGDGAEDVYKCGISALYPIPSSPMTLEDAMAQTPQLVRETAERMFRTLHLGINLNH